MIKTSCFLLTCLAACTASHADVFRSINDHGITEFSDRATSTKSRKFTISKPVIIQPLSETPTLNTTKTGQGIQQFEPSTSAGLYKGIRIIEPQDNSSSWINKDVSVKIDLDPGLAAGHEVVVMLDGNEVATGPHFNFSIPEIDRGLHTLQARVRDKASGELLSSETISFQVHQRTDQGDTEMLHPSLQTETTVNPSDISVILSY